MGDPVGEASHHLVRGDSRTVTIVLGYSVDGGEVSLRTGGRGAIFLGRASTGSDLRCLKGVAVGEGAVQPVKEY